ncbi:MAG: hypothetical protein AAF726_03780 [Planctomycetota bacterium]
MTQDDDLRDFFAEERARDRRCAPEFRDLVDASREMNVPRVIGRRRRRARAVWLVTFAAATALAVARLDVQRDEPVETTDIVDVDAACDAALAALEDQEADAHMRLTTDALLGGSEATPN